MIEAGIQEKNIDWYYIINLCSQFSKDLFHREFAIYVEIIEYYFSFSLKLKKSYKSHLPINGFIKENKVNQKNKGI